MAQQLDLISALSSKLNNMSKMQEMLQRDIKKTNDKLYDTKENIDLKFISTKEDYTERFNEFDNIY